jgi:hypothetical protein
VLRKARAVTAARASLLLRQSDFDCRDSEIHFQQRRSLVVRGKTVKQFLSDGIIWEKRNGTTPQAQFGNELERFALALDMGYTSGKFGESRSPQALVQSRSLPVIIFSSLVSRVPVQSRAAIVCLVV